MPRQKSNLPKKTKSKTNPATQDATLTAKLREIEAKIVKHLQHHATVAQKLTDEGTTAKVVAALRNPERARQLAKLHDSPLTTECIGSVLRELASGIESATRRQRVAFLGPLHSYSHLATLEKFGRSADLVPVRTIAAVFGEVSSGQADAGVVPIENSTDGRIVDTLEKLTHASVMICGEVPLRIHHNLLGSGMREDVVEVCSKPQALSQCRDWLASHLPDAKLTSMSSTTAAAELASKDPKIAAVASYQAGVEYGLKVLAKNIEDNKDNITRFAVIGPKAAKRTGKDKTSLMFELAHEPGALADAMIVFKKTD